jgi:hypothetical protein
MRIASISSTFEVLKDDIVRVVAFVSYGVLRSCECMFDRSTGNKGCIWRLEEAPEACEKRRSCEVSGVRVSLSVAKCAPRVSLFAWWGVYVAAKMHRPASDGAGDVCRRKNRGSAKGKIVV